MLPAFSAAAIGSFGGEVALRYLDLENEQAQLKLPTKD
jgi:hypothetical protein